MSTPNLPPPTERGSLDILHVSGMALFLFAVAIASFLGWGKDRKRRQENVKALPRKYMRIRPEDLPAPIVSMISSGRSYAMQLRRRLMRNYKDSGRQPHPPADIVINVANIDADNRTHTHPHAHTLTQSPYQNQKQDKERDKERHRDGSTVPDVGWGYPVSLNETPWELIHYKKEIARLAVVVIDAAAIECNNEFARLPTETFESYVNFLVEQNKNGNTGIRYPLNEHLARKIIKWYQRARFSLDEFTTAEFGSFMKDLLTFVQPIEQSIQANRWKVGKHDTS